MKKLITAFMFLFFTVNVNAATASFYKVTTEKLVEDIVACSTVILQTHDLECATDILHMLPEDFEFPPKDELMVVLDEEQISYDEFVVDSITVQYGATCGDNEAVLGWEAPVCAMFLELLNHEH